MHTLPQNWKNAGIPDGPVTMPEGGDDHNGGFGEPLMLSAMSALGIEVPNSLMAPTALHPSGYNFTAAKMTSPLAPFSDPSVLAVTTPHPVPDMGVFDFSAIPVAAATSSVSLGDLTFDLERDFGLGLYNTHLDSETISDDFDNFPASGEGDSDRSLNFNLDVLASGAPPDSHIGTAATPSHSQTPFPSGVLSTTATAHSSQSGMSLEEFYLAFSGPYVPYRNDLSTTPSISRPVLDNSGKLTAPLPFPQLESSASLTLVDRGSTESASGAQVTQPQSGPPPKAGLIPGNSDPPVQAEEQPTVAAPDGLEAPKNAKSIQRPIIGKKRKQSSERQEEGSKVSAVVPAIKKAKAKKTEPLGPVRVSKRSGIRRNMERVLTILHRLHLDGYTNKSVLVREPQTVNPTA